MKKNYLSSLMSLFMVMTLWGGAVSASAADFVKFRDADGSENLDIYQVFVTLENQMLRDAGVNSFLSTPNTEAITSPSYMESAQLAPGKTHPAIWRFTITGDEGYGLISSLGHYLVMDGENKVGLNGNWGTLTNINGMGMHLTVNYIDNTSVAELKVSNKQGSDLYLAVEPNDSAYSVVLKSTPDASTRWEIKRAYESENMVLPRHSDPKSDNPSLLTVQVLKGEYLALSDNNQYLECTGMSDRIYWIYSYENNGSGRARLISRSGYDAYCVQASGIVYTSKDGGSVGHWAFIPIEGEDDAMVFSPLTNNLTYYTIENPYALYWYDYSGMCNCANWGLGLSGLKKGNRLNYLWRPAMVDDPGILEFAYIQNQTLTELENYKNSVPWAHSVLDEGISKIKGINPASFPSSDMAVDEINNLRTKLINNFIEALNKEAIGKVANLVNVSRRNAGLPAYMAAKLNNRNRMKLTVDSIGREHGRWIFEEATDGKFYIKNTNDYYMGVPAGGASLDAVNTVSKAGKFTFDVANGHVVLNDGNAANSLTVSTTSTEIKGGNADAADAALIVLASNIMEQVEGMPEYSTSENRKLYLIRSASNPSLYMESASNRTSLNVVSNKTPDCYWYFVADPNNDGCVLVSDNYGTMVGNMSGFTGCYSDYSTTFFIEPAPDGKEGFYLSTTSPASALLYWDDNTYCNVGSSDWEHAAFIFEPTEGVDHEGIYAERRDKLVASLKNILLSSPFGNDIIKDALTRLDGSPMKNWGAESNSAISAINYMYNNTVLDYEYNLEEEPEGKSVMFVNVRRQQVGQAPYLAAAEDGSVNSSTEASVAATTWTMEYFVNGQWYLRNANGSYLAGLSDDIHTVSDKADAGTYNLLIVNDCISIAAGNNKNNGLNLDTAGSNLCGYSASDAGSAWRIELSEYVNSIVSVGADSTNAPVEYYNLQGVRVPSSQLLPGIYLRRCGNETMKVVVE